MAEKFSNDAWRCVIDARGLTCPLPVLRVEKWAREAFVPGPVDILVTDPVALDDISVLATARGWTVVGIDSLPDHYLIRLKVAPSALEDARRQQSGK